MRARPRDWLKFGVAVGLSVVAVVGIALLLNLTGDCAPSVTDCGGPQRRASFVVLGVGTVWLTYLVVTFIRSPSTFR